MEKVQADNLAITCFEQKIKLEEMEDAANANEYAIVSAGGKRKRGNEEHAFTSNDGTNIEGVTGDNNMEEKIMGISLLERDNSILMC